MAIAGSDVESQSPTLRNYAFENDSFGLPLACGASWYGSDTVSGSDSCAALPQESLRSYLPIGNAAGETRLQQFFAKAFNIATFSATGGTIQPPSSWDVGDSNSSGLVPPQIYSLNPATCNTNDPNVHCTAGEKDNISVNGINYTTRDYNMDGVKEEDQYGAQNVVDGYGLIGKNTYQATVRFFAFADKNRMPIRRVLVNWGDDTTTPADTNTRGLYKNRKPYCGDSSGSSKECSVSGSSDYSGLTCKDGVECEVAFGNNTTNLNTAYNCNDPLASFGNADRACDEGWFEFTNNYSCSPEELNEFGKKVIDLKTENIDIYNRLLQMSLIDDDFVCVFKPKVQVLDNWGWCNGRCATNYSGPNPNSSNPNVGEGCYDEKLVGSSQIRRQCTDFEQDSDVLIPWTKYAGQIIVIPNGE